MRLAIVIHGFLFINIWCNNFVYRMALEEIRHDLQERNQRWQGIESYCGFPIRSNPGLAKLDAILYGESGIN